MDDEDTRKKLIELMTQSAMIATKYHFCRPGEAHHEATSKEIQELAEAMHHSAMVAMKEYWDRAAPKPEASKPVGGAASMPDLVAISDSESD